MTATYGAIGRIDYGSRTNTVVPMPASVGSGDHLLLVHVTANSGTAVTATLPVAFTAVSGYTPQTGSDGSFGWRCILGERIAGGSEPSDYTVTHSSTNSEAMIIRTDGTGTLSIDSFSQNHTATTTLTASMSAVSPTVTDALLYFVMLNWDETARTPPTGMTERQDAQFLYLASQALSASGSTGTRTMALGSSAPWFANGVAIKDVAGGGSVVGSRNLGGLLQGKGLVGPWR